ncbi:FAD-dependent oxidoreductase [Paracoccus sp. S3-43]|uniref:NAD(P)/FAD-dependent oxidoreductase n=1 Tax=Paracoccus sp. S3-43 TaxID=3030011 RepID=UPI0023AF82EA|nr:FAD-dependent oxidoreductase [Paracoccus sp. S3-43]WEF26012.1 FAD-dependent oxidoreductase [Paracoccus sp. S3-43]
MRIVIVGAGQAAASMAARLRAKGHDGEIVVIGAEPAAPYQRPPLSKAYLLGQMGQDRLVLRGDDWWRDQRIALRLGETAKALDAARRVVVTDRGEVTYDALALTTGAHARRLPAAMGGDLPGVHVIRTLADVDALAPQMRPGRRLIVIGGGYIGLEAAAVARKLDLSVTLIEAAPRILGRVAVAETADMIRTLHLAHGVRILEGTGISRITGSDRATGVALTDGRDLPAHLPADLIVTGIGVLPETDLAQTAGLVLDNGIATDALGRSSDPAIWAAGDCASFPWQGGRLRLESVGNAIDMAEAVADNILGANTPYHPKPWFWSDQFDAKLQIAGLGIGHDRIVTRAGDGQHGGSVWYFREKRLIAVDALNDARAYMIGKRLIEAGRSPDPEAIPTTPDLKALLA